MKGLYVVTVVSGPRDNPRTLYATLKGGIGEAFSIGFTSYTVEKTVLNEEWALRALEIARKDKTYRSLKLFPVELGKRVGPSRVNQMLRERLAKEKGLSERDLKLLKTG